MRIYEIPILWESIKTYSIEAESLQEAVTKALKQFFSEPDEHYIEDSFSIDGIIEDEYSDEDYNLNEAIQKL